MKQTASDNAIEPFGRQALELSSHLLAARSAGGGRPGNKPILVLEDAHWEHRWIAPGAGMGSDIYTWWGTYDAMGYGGCWQGARLLGSEVTKRASFMYTWQHAVGWQQWVQ